MPDKKYLYHLHFEIAMNPLIDKEAGTHSFEDVLLWPYWGKGRGTTWVANNDDALFE